MLGRYKHMTCSVMHIAINTEPDGHDGATYNVTKEMLKNTNMFTRVRNDL
jgi:hypothetical protein